jgi:hypothetical protein
MVVVIMEVMVGLLQQVLAVVVAEAVMEEEVVV